jgi:hypothetical protein
MTRTVLAAAIVMTVLIPGSLSGGLGMSAEKDATVSDTSTVRPHQLGQALFRSVLSEDIDWKPFPAFPPSVRLAVVVGRPSEAGPYTIRVRVPHGVKLMPHRHPEDRAHSNCRLVLHRPGRSIRRRQAAGYPPGSVVLPGTRPTSLGEIQ